MTSKEQTKYRSTSQWKDFRRRMLSLRNCQCEICGIKKAAGLNVHHLDGAHYKDLDPAKFLVLCKRCHRLLEQLLIRKDFSIDQFAYSLVSAYQETKHWGDK